MSERQTKYFWFQLKRKFVRSAVCRFYNSFQSCWKRLKRRGSNRKRKNFYVFISEQSWRVFLIFACKLQKSRSFIHSHNYAHNNDILELRKFERFRISSDDAVMRVIINGGKSFWNISAIFKILRSTFKLFYTYYIILFSNSM